MTDATRPSYVKDKKKVEQEFADGTEASLAQEILELYEEKKEHEARAKEINKILDGQDEIGPDDVTKTGKFIPGKYHELAAILEAKGIDLMRVPGLGSFWTSPENYPSIVDEEAFFAYLDETKQGHIAKRNVHYQTLRGWVNGQLKANIALPPCLNNFPKTKIRFRRSNPK